MTAKNPGVAVTMPNMQNCSDGSLDARIDPERCCAVKEKRCTGYGHIPDFCTVGDWPGDLRKWQPTPVISYPNYGYPYVPPKEEAKWLDIEVNSGGYDYIPGWVCTACENKFLQERFNYKRPNFCPECGRPIRKEREDAED